MEKQVDLANWDEFEDRISEIQRIQKSAAGAISPFLFRGHSDARWSLATTLERRGKSKMVLSDYYHSASNMKFEIESLTGYRWEIPDVLQIYETFTEYDNGKDLTLKGMPAYDYLTHIRHNGFPSPLLDWSRSPFVAAYFAFSGAKNAERVSIYAFCERPSGRKTGGSDKARIIGLGPNVRTHRRHFLQQSEYTICVHFQEKWYFEIHDDVFAQNEPGQDRLWKFSIPTSERGRVLKQLDRYNLNAYSLFGSEESLMETMAWRTFENP